MLLKRQKKRLKNNILLYITICWNIKNHFLNETKQRQEFDMSGMLCNVGGPSIGSYKFSRPNTLAFCLAIRQYLITLFGRYDKRIVIPGKDSTINVYIPIFEWCTNRFNLTPDTLFNGRQYHPRDRICKVTLHALLLHEIAPYASTIKVLINRASVFLSTLQILAILRCETSAFNSSCMRILLSWSLYFSGALFSL